VHHDFSAPRQLTAAVSGATVKFADFDIVRGATLVESTSWKNPPLMCVCHETVTIANANGTTSHATATTVVFPLQLFALAIAALIMLILVTWLVRRRFHSRVATEARRLNDEGE